MTFESFYKNINLYKTNQSVKNSLLCDINNKLLTYCYDLQIVNDRGLVLIFCDEENADNITPNYCIHEYKRHSYAKDFDVKVVFNDKWYDIISFANSNAYNVTISV